jgi:hypothetical protein
VNSIKLRSFCITKEQLTELKEPTEWEEIFANGTSNMDWDPDYIMNSKT